MRVKEKIPLNTFPLDSTTRDELESKFIPLQRNTKKKKICLLIKPLLKLVALS